MYTLKLNNAFELVTVNFWFCKSVCSVLSWLDGCLVGRSLMCWYLHSLVALHGATFRSFTVQLQVVKSKQWLKINKATKHNIHWEREEKEQKKKLRRQNMNIQIKYSYWASKWSNFSMHIPPHTNTHFFLMHTFLHHLKNMPIPLSLFKLHA